MLTVGFGTAAIFVVLIVVSFLKLFYLAVHGFNCFISVFEQNDPGSDVRLYVTLMSLTF